MLQELTITPSTAIVLVVILLCAILAVLRLFRRGLCDCHDGCEGCSGKKKKLHGKSECSHCGAAESMVSNMEVLLKPSDK